MTVNLMNASVPIFTGRVEVHFDVGSTGIPICTQVNRNLLINHQTSNLWRTNDEMFAYETAVVRGGAYVVTV